MPKTEVKLGVATAVDSRPALVASPEVMPLYYCFCIHSKLTFPAARLPVSFKPSL